MLYEMMFLTKQPSFVLATAEKTWENTKIKVEERNEIVDYLGKDVFWESAPTRIGFGGCGSLETKEGSTFITFRLSKEGLREILLTISFLLQRLEYLQEQEESFLTIRNLCGQTHPLFGYVSSEFRRGLLSIEDTGKDTVIKNMQRVFRSVVPMDLTRFASECTMTICRTEERFALICFGDACDVAIYPDQGRYGTQTRFSCHNLDSDFQQATLLAGLVTLGSLIRKAA